VALKVASSCRLTRLVNSEFRVFLSYTEFLNKYHCKSCPLAFNGIIATLKTIRKRFKENIDRQETVEAESFTNPAN